MRLSLMASALAVTFTAHAQEAPATPPPKVEVKGSADAYNARRDDTASRIVVNHDEIIKYGDSSILDVLKRLPGITVSGNGGRGGEVRMRGLGGGYTQVLIDGERAPPGFSIETLAPASIERIEIIRAATAEFSTQAIAGTINIVLRKTVKTAQREVSVQASAGEGTGLSPAFNVLMSDKRDKLSWSLGINGNRNNFGRTAPVHEVQADPAGNVTLQREHSVVDDGHDAGMQLLPRVNWTFANGDTLTSQSTVHVNNYARHTYDSSHAVIGEDSAYPYSEEHVMSHGVYAQSSLNWVKKLASGAKLDIKASGSFSRQFEDIGRLGYMSDDTVASQITESQGDNTRFSTTGKYALSLGQGHALATGWDAGRNRNHEMRRENHLGPDDYVADVTRLAVFAQDEWNVTPLWSVYLGARWEGIATAASGNTFDDVRSRTSVVSPVVQTLYKLAGGKGDQLRFALARTYRAPGPYNLLPARGRSTNNSRTELDAQGNPHLKPELAIGFDAGYEHYWADGAMVSASVSAREIDDVVRGTTFQDADGRYVFTTINDGKAHTRGLELEAKFPLKAILNDAPAVDLRASISRNWSSVDAVSGPNNRLQQQTPFSANLGLDYKAGKLTTGASYAFRTGGPVRMSLTESSYQTVRRDLEAYALWKFDAHYQLRLTVTNLLGQDSTNERIYTDASGSERRIAVFPSFALFRVVLEMKY
ncbi:MAG: TonB-dependent receptor [Pseudomonadota bacterium]